MNLSKIATFEKVSFEQYMSDCTKCGHWNSTENLRKEWENIKLPTRATTGSAGYDFYLPYEQAVSVNPVQVPTGIRCRIEPGWVLVCCPKSGLGFKYSMMLENTIGIIDSDYYNSDNEGHIQAKFHTEIPTIIKPGQKFMQGIFMPYGITTDDECDGVRNGGFGSTGV
jgi:dUTP pyrophosphatase